MTICCLYLNRAVRRIILSLTLTLAVAVTTAQESHTSHSSLTDFIIGNTHDIIEETGHFIDEHLDAKDTVYISPNLYNFTIMPQYSSYYEYYRFSSKEKEQSITLRPESQNKIGLYLGWRWIFLGYSVDIGGGNPQTDINLSFYTSKLGIDLFYRKRNEGYKIKRLDGFGENGGDLEDYIAKFDGLSVEQQGVNLYYVFNNQKFSYPAAYSQSTNQRISAGSFILGVSYNEQSFTFDHTKFDIRIQENLLPELKFNTVKYKDFSINFGYSYNWVFKKDWLANISFTPAVGYKNTSLRLTNSKDFLSSINFDLITRAAIVYNNSKYYAGASLVSHTYSYNKSSLSILNGFGVINVYVGFNFWRKK